MFQIGHLRDHLKYATFLSNVWGFQFVYILAIFVIFCILDYSSVCEIVSHCGLNLHFPDFPEACVSYPRSYPLPGASVWDSETQPLAVVGMVLKGHSHRGGCGGGCGLGYSCCTVFSFSLCLSWFRHFFPDVVSDSTTPNAHVAQSWSVSQESRDSRSRELTNLESE